MLLVTSFKDELSSIDKNLVELFIDYLPSEATFYQEIRLWNPDWQNEKVKIYIYIPKSLKYIRSEKMGNIFPISAQY